MVKRIIIYVVLAAIAYYVIYKYVIEKGTYLKYLKGELGMNIADRMSYDEVKTSYIYLHDYARRYGANAATMLQASNPALYAKAKIIADKYKLFNLA